MIFRRSPLIFPTSLVILLAGVLLARANQESSQTNGLRSPPADAVDVAKTVAPATETTEHDPKESQSVEPVVPAASAASEKNKENEETKSPDSAAGGEDPHREITGLQTLGLNLTERSDWDAAEIAFRQILRSPRANKNDLASALLGLARVYRRQGSFTKAAAIYERYLKDYPTAIYVPDALLELGRTQRALGANQLAISHFYNVINSTIKLSSENSEHYQVLAKTAQFEIAETHFQEGNYAEANKFYSRLRLLDLAPSDRARAHFKSADALYREGDFAGTVKTVNSYLEQWPKDENVPEARYLLSLSLRSLGQKQEALDATLALLRNEQTGSDPKRWSYWQRRTGNQLANDFFQSGDTLNALVIYQGLSALSAEPEWRLPLAYQIGLCYERMRLYDRAAASYQSIVDHGQPAAADSNPEAKIKKISEVVKAPNAELTELARMAAWRIGQLTWHEQTERQLAGVFATDPETVPKTPQETHALAPNIDTNVSSQPTPNPGNDHSGNAAKTSANL